jgi:hypothetical protein
MESMTASTTERRIDELGEEMRRGFDRADADIRELRGEVKDLRIEMNGGFKAIEATMDARFEAADAKFDAKFDRLNRTIIYLLGGSLSVLTAGLLAAAIHALF